MVNLIQRSPLQELFQRCTVKLLDRGGNLIGTGFFVTPRKLATCYHVLFPKEQSDRLHFQISGMPDVFPLQNCCRYQREFDLLIIDLGREVSECCINLEFEASQSLSQLWGWSFNSNYPAGVGLVPILQEEAIHQGYPILRVQRDAIRQGSSGTPILNLETGKLLGITYWLKEDDALIIPTKCFQEFFSDVFLENQQHHQIDPYWYKAQKESKNQSRKYLTRIPSLDLSKELVGREVEVAKLKIKLEHTSKFVSINGIGGIGKTTLAVAYMQRYGYQFNHLAWVNRGEDLIASIALNEDLADSLNMPFEEKEEINGRFRRVLRKLNQLPGHNLLIIDNVQDQVAQKEIYNTLPSSPYWKVLVTSRVILNGFESILLDTLLPIDAQILFRTYCHASHSETELDELLKEVGYHTLTIELLAKLLDKLNNILNINELTNALKKKQLHNIDLQEGLWSRHSGEESGIYLHLIKVFELSQLSEQEKSVLIQFIVLPVEQYNVALLADLIQERPFNLNYALNNLSSKGWLTLHSNKSFSMHRLIRQVVNYQLHPEFCEVEKLIETVIEKIKIDAYTNPITSCVPWLVYATTIEQFFADENNIQLSSLQNNIAEIYRVLGQYDQALLFNQKAKRLREKNLPPDHQDLATTFSNLALTLQALGNYHEALELHRKSLEIRNLGLDSKHSDLAEIFNNIGTVYALLEQHEKSLEYHQKSKLILESSKEPNHPYLACSYQNISEVYLSLWKYEKALDFGQKALEIREKSLDSKHPDMSQSYNSIGAIYSAMGEHEKSLNFFHLAEGIREEILNPNHPDLAQTYNNIGLANYKLKKYQTSLEYFKKALDILELSLPFNHPYFIICYNNIKQLYSVLGMHKDAKRYRDKIDNIRRHNIGLNRLNKK